MNLCLTSAPFMRPSALGLIKTFSLIGLLFTAFAALAQTPPDPKHPGKTIYDKACATCHASPADVRVPTLTTLSAMSAGQLSDAMSEGGKMTPMPTTQYTGKVSSTGVKQRSPSGAPIWSYPVIDEKRNRVIVTTGENTSHPGTDTSDAVIAIDLDTGREAWKFQAMALDVWNMACSADKEGSGPNCPWNIEGDPGTGRDFDFGAGAIIAKGANGKDVVLAGQKSGDTWALDAETGKLSWNVRFGEGTALGGVHWGISTDGERLFAAINDPIIAGTQTPRPGVYAVDIKTGKSVWGYDAKPNCDGERSKLVANCETKYGFSAAPLTVDGAVIAATLGGEVMILDSQTGEELNRIDTVGPVNVINNIEAAGGSIDSHCISAGAGMIFINSGYGSFGQTTGNA